MHIPLERIKRLFRLALPIMAGMSTYVLLELVDMLFVGHFGTAALASVGIAGFLTFLFLALFGGTSVAVQATTSRLVGEGVEADLGRYLRTMVLITVVVLPPLTVLLITQAPHILALMIDDPEVVATGTGYFQWLLGSITLFALNGAFMGYWNAIERSDLYLRVVIVEAIINAPLNYMFMFGLGPIPSFGVTGAGIGTFIAASIGICYHLYQTQKYLPGFISGPVREHLAVTMRLFIPASTQQFFDSLALTLMFRIVALVGTAEVAAYTVLVNLVNAVAMPAWGLGLAGATLVGQSMGAKDVVEADRWAWDVIKIGAVSMFVLGMPFWLLPDLILSVFIHDPEVVALARLPCQILGIFIAFNGIGYLFASMLNGAGDVKRVMYVNLVTQYVVLLPGAYLFGPTFGFGLLGIWLVHQAGFRALNSVILTMLWRQKKWQKVSLW